MPKDHVVGIWVLPLVRQRLEAAARADHRSLSQFCTIILDNWMEQSGGQIPAGPPITENRVNIGVRMDDATKAKFQAVADDQNLPFSAACGRILGHWAVTKGRGARRKRAAAPERSAG